ncbi:MAG TPA: DegT/DnrJ/EryC1/StrS family aminotransferase [Flavisolibacter sp.]|nr:DegT/DnrJ/EryC1/StrS family aminotransferase [Flavisolibacter sp.]
MINVTKTFLPPYHEYEPYLKDIYNRAWLTNNGPLLNELELKLKEYLDVDHMLVLSNGTIALQMALKALDIKGEVITTPFSYVATTSSIVWENCQPVFVDIDEDDFNIDPGKIEAAITPQTTAILATHVYGNACKIDEIRQIAEKHNLKVIYDAAHCFGTSYKNRSIFNYGDVVTTSFHATKIFQTVEGGAVFTQDPQLLRRLSLLRNFGHTSPTSFEGVGINAKNSELHAAMGLCVLKYMPQILETRKKQWLYYLQKLAGLHCRFLKINTDCEFNYSYFPIVFKTEESLVKSIEALNNQYVFPRRYFFPSLSTLDYVNKFDCPVAEDISPKVLCLPLYHDLKQEEQDMICRILLRVQNN